ncbi:terminase small subunit [Georgenia sp. MJ170]|uniref:terminase small subunit n=1 Tax=Georgenia sunbinii TaxID=3117728 RepID=UPI002F267B35
MSVWDETDEAIGVARDAGTITDADGGAVAMLLRLAERMDDPDFPVIDGRFDNVTESLYLKACDALGLTPAGREKLGVRKGGEGGKLAELRDGIPSLDAKRKSKRGA